MPLDIGEHRGQSEGHGLHYIKGKSLAAAGGHAKVGSTVVLLDVGRKSGEANAVGNALLLRECAAIIEQCTAAGQKEYGVRQLRHGADEHFLVLAAGEFRRVDEHECVFGQFHRTAQGAFFLR